MTEAHQAAPLLRTPLHKLHAERGARLMAFAGYEMPVQYPHRHDRAQPVRPFGMTGRPEVVQARWMGDQQGGHQATTVNRYGEIAFVQNSTANAARSRPCLNGQPPAASSRSRRRRSFLRRGSWSAAQVSALGKTTAEKVAAI